MVHKKMIPCHTTEALVVIKEYQDGILSGVLRHPRLDTPVPIHSTAHLIFLMDSLLEMQDCPDSPLPLVRPILKEEDSIATFQIQVLFREHSTWQGRLVWKEMETEASFRSVLELMKLLDEILAI